MDIITYALLNKKIKNVTLAYTYKGSAASVSALPEDADTGDLYTVGADQYVWDGTAWILIGGTITHAQIAALWE